MLSTSAFLRFAAGACLSAVVRRRSLNCLWEITYRCNARCSFCGYWRNPSPSSGELTASQIADGLRRISSRGLRFVNFTGGEPTLRPDLPEIIAAAAQLGLWTSIVTNGSTLCRDHIRRLRTAGLCNLLVSLDSLDPPDHDSHRSLPGLFGKVASLVEWLRADFLSAYRTGGIMWVVRNANLDQLEAAAAWADCRGVFLVIQPHHRRKTEGAPGSEAVLPSGAESRLLDLRRRHPCILNSSAYLRGVAAFCSSSPPRSPCRAGGKYFSVDPAGFLHPCVDLPAAGHVLRDSLNVLASPQALRAIGACQGCWYCFRGEADCSAGLRGCTGKLAVAARVIARNAIAAAQPRPLPSD